MGNNTLVKEIKESFDPIAKKFGMSELPIKQHTNIEQSFGYAEKDIGIEVSVDLSGFFIFVLIFKVRGQEIPAGYEDEFGVVQKMYIQHALKKIGIDTSSETKELQKLGGSYLNSSEMISILSLLLEKYWNTIKANWEFIFK